MSLHRQGNSNLVWLASYPRSGNTWLRIIFFHILNSSHHTVDINSIDIGLHAASRTIFEALGYISSEMTQDEISNLRPAAYKYFSIRNPDLEFVKVHDFYGHTPNGNSLFPRAATKVAIYIIRNPLDVVVSLSHHLNISLDDAIECLNSNYTISADETRCSRQLQQVVSNWSHHVSSWTKQSDLPVIIVRYEDLSVSPLQSLQNILSSIDIIVDSSSIERAVELSGFSYLQNQELVHGFPEKANIPSLFFREGKIGSWQNLLADTQVAKIIERHGKVMEQFGYQLE
jgi:hypothetical protein